MNVLNPSHPVWSWLLKNSAQAAVLVLLILAAQWIFRQKLPPSWRCALWWLVLIRLAIPVSPSSPLSVFNWMRWNSERPPAVGSTDSSVAGHGHDLPSPPVQTMQSSPNWPVADLAAGPLSSAERSPALANQALAPAVVLSQPIPAYFKIAWREAAMWLWCAGAAGLLAQLWIAALRLRQQLRRATPVSDAAVLELLEHCRQRMRVRGRLQLVATPQVNSPALCGLFRPRLLLPPGLTDSFTPQELRFVFLHELAHLKRHDIAVNWLMSLLQIVHWFNPFAWLAFQRLRADRESACDALALSAAEAGEQHAYGQTIIKLLETFARPSPLPGLIGILEDQSQIKRRIRMIAQFRRSPRRPWTSAIVAMILGAVCLTDAQLPATKEAKRENAVTIPSPGALDARPVVAFAELKDQTAVFTLRDGLTVHGRVVDNAGRPIGAALVREGYGHGNIVRVSEFTVGADGRFARSNRAPRQWIYTASAEGHATTSVIAQVEPGMKEVRLVLPPAKPLRLRVLDKAGNAVPNATVTLFAYRNEGQILDWSGAADADGRVVWTNAPTVPVMFSVHSAKLAAARKFEAQADESEKICTLTKAASQRATIQVKAIDAKNRAPVQMRWISALYNGETTFKPLTDPAASQATVEVWASDFKVGMGTSYKLKIEADGYEPFITDFIDVDQGDQVIEAALVPGDRIQGVALLPDGKPAAGARVFVRAQEDAFVHASAPGRYYGIGWTQVQTREDGRFRLRPLPNDPPVIFTHTNAFLETTLTKLRGQPEVRLAPLGQIEGRLLVAGQPKSGTTVRLASQNRPAPFWLTFNTTSGADGGFRFTNVPPGEYFLCREYLLYRSATPRMGFSGPSHQMPVTIKAGETLRVDYGIRGRAVKGQAIADPPETSVDWQNSYHILTLKLSGASAPVVNREDYATSKAFRAAHTESLNSPERTRQLRAARNYELVFERDGSFQMDDVPPGTYDLRIKVADPRYRHRPIFARPEETLGSLVKEIVVPPGDGVLDLGKVTVPMKSGKAGWQDATVLP